MTMTTSVSPSGGLTGRKVFVILACFFGTVASADTFLLTSAVRTWSGTEATSPYKAGQLYNRERALARSQDALSGRALAAVLERPTDQRADRKAPLVEAAAGFYVAVIGDVAPGQWDLVVDVLDGSDREFRRRARIVLR
jgi:nitrogen fixation protein FixH